MISKTSAKYLAAISLSAAVFAAVPSAFAGFGHRLVRSPVLSQTPPSWHWSLPSQMIGSPPTQLPDWHVSLRLQGFPSLHAVPFGAPLQGLPWEANVALTDLFAVMVMEVGFAVPVI